MYSGELENDLEIITASRNKIHHLLNEQKKRLRDQSKHSPLDPSIKHHNGKSILSNLHSDKLFATIIEQQAKIKEIVQIDQQIVHLRQANKTTRTMIEKLREQCAKVALNSMNRRQNLIEAQQKEIEDYRSLASKGVIDEYKRHVTILKNKQKECEELRAEIKAEEESRAEYLKKYEEDLNKMLEKKKDRHIGLSTNRSSARTNDPFDEEDDIQLCTIDEYHPYGTPTDQPPKKTTQRYPKRTRRSEFL